MRTFILTAAAIVALTIGATPAMADHNRPPRATYCAPYGYASPYRSSYHSYRYSPYSVNRYQVHRYSPYGHYGHGHIHGHHHGHSSHYGSGIGIHGRNYSFHIGF